MGNENELQPQPGSLPIISEHTKNIIIEDLGEQTDDRTKRIIQGITGEKAQNPLTVRRQFAQGVFSDLAASKPEFLQVTLDSLKKQHTEVLTNMTDAATIGMAVVLKAFNIESDYNLLPNMSKLENEDLELLRSTIEENIPSQKESCNNMTILEEILKLPSIPEQQINLNTCVKKAQEAYHHGSGLYYEIRRGASTMYLTLSKLWPKLNAQLPQQPNTF